MRPKRVLVTGAGALLGQGIIRSLLESSLNVEVIAADPSPLSAGLYWTESRRLLPMATHPGYVDAVAAILHEERPDAVLVGTDVELIALAEARLELERRFSTQIVVSDPAVIRIADDKYETYRFLEGAGFPAPASRLPGKERELVEKLGFPLIVKPRVGARSIGVHVVTDERQLSAALAAVTEPVIQQCVGTDRAEYTAGVLCFDGRCAASIVMRRDLRDGNTYRAFVDSFPELNEFARRVAEKLRPHGPANFQFRLDDDQPKIFEIKARFSGTTPLRMRAGFNEVEMTLRRLLDGAPVEAPEVRPMTILRHWSETVVSNEEISRLK
jgi:carbamoyl-phosphate synthase large subunit